MENQYKYTQLYTYRLALQKSYRIITILIVKRMNNCVLIYNYICFETRRNVVLKILGCSESCLRAKIWLTSDFLLLSSLEGGKYEWNLFAVESTILIFCVLDTAKSLLDWICRMLVIASDTFWLIITVFILKSHVTA